MSNDLKTMTDVEVVAAWMKARTEDGSRAGELLAESQRRGHKRIAKAFDAINRASESA